MTPLFASFRLRRRRAPVPGEAGGWLGAGRHRRAAHRRDARRGQGFGRGPPWCNGRVSGFVIVISGADTEPTVLEKIAIIGRETTSFAIIGLQSSTSLKRHLKRWHFVLDDIWCIS